MAQQTLVCPRCGEKIQRNESAKGCFCPECGMKLSGEENGSGAALEGEDRPLPPPAPEETAPQGSPGMREGTVPPPPPPAAEPAPLVDAVPEVPAPTGYAAELDKLFREGAYKEVYDGCAQLVEANSGDIRALYRKGISAVYLSEGAILRTAEFRSLVSTATGMMAKTGDYSLAPEKDEDILAMLAYRTEHAGFETTLASLEDCTSRFNAWCALAGLYQEAAALITSEALREKALKAGAQFCDKALYFPMRYTAGTKQTKSGKEKALYEEYNPDKKQRTALKEARKHLSDAFNGLASRAAEEERLKADEGALKQRVSLLKKEVRSLKEKCRAARKLALCENPQIREGDKKILRKSGIICGGFLVLLLGAGVFALIKQKTFLFILLLLIALGYIAAAVFMVHRAVAEYEMKYFPEALQRDYHALRADERELKKARRISLAARKALKRFNRTKLKF